MSSSSPNSSLAGPASGAEVIVVGTGPNGLAAALTLAEAGCKVRVLEAQSTIGGGARSAELTLPRFMHDRCSAIHPLGLGSPFFKHTALEKDGLEWIHPDYAVAHPLDDGSAALLHRSLEDSCQGLGVDGAAWRRLMEPLVQQWDALAGEILQPMLHVPRHPWLLARFGLLALQSASRLTSGHFHGAHAAALFAGIAAHSFLPLEAAGSAAIGLVLGAAGHAVGWPLPRGGSQRISDLLAARIRSLGGTIETSRPVEDVREFAGTRTRATLLDLTAWNAARIAGSVLPDGYRHRLEHFRHGPGIFKVDYALAAPIPWTAEACGRAGTVHLGGALEEVAHAERQVAQGEVPRSPFVLLTQPTVSDPSRAPEGRHIAWAYCHVPYGCPVDMTAAIEAQIERFAPGFRERILARCVTSPGTIAQGNANLTGGDISGGACDLWQLIARPVLGFDPYRMPIRDDAGGSLYLCSSSTPPGGGVHGMCGFHAAQSALGRM